MELKPLGWVVVIPVCVRIMMNINTCLCGHDRDTHQFYTSVNREPCGFLSKTTEGYLIVQAACQCQSFKGDNLRYLEQLNEQKEKED